MGPVSGRSISAVQGDKTLRRVESTVHVQTELTRMQPQHRRLKFAVHQQINNRLAALERLIDRRLLVFARRMQYEVGHVLLELQCARMADADAQAPEFRRR